MACQRSGECCRKVGFTVKPAKYMLDLLVAHGLVEEGREQLQLMVWHDCQHLEWDGEYALCAIYEDRPDFCKDFMCPRAKGATKVPQVRAVIV